MTNIKIKQRKFKNAESPFTELFSLLRRYELLPQGHLTLAYHT
ncbi:MAG: hypothetical protein K0S27_729, partial [Gammaproteobacteria bacterium]|nr:hypothetical protein [Gammaproteobacteria bacterium]